MGNSWLGKPNGVFCLSDSNRHVGSFILKEDVKTIMDVSDSDISGLTFMMIDSQECIDEKYLRKEWHKGEIPHAPCHYCGNARVSLDEIILAAIVRYTYPDAIIKRQKKWKRKQIDLYFELNGRKTYIEFLGPNHFMKADKLEKDYDRIRQLSEEEQCPCYLWPFWIQRCSMNLRILIGEEQKQNGRVALWSTNGFFGNFKCKSSDILKLTNQFRALINGSIGYGYDEWNSEKFVKPEHPIVEEIIKGKKKYKILIPKDVPIEEEDKWLPSRVVEWKRMTPIL